MREPNVDGALVGGASLDVKEFADKAMAVAAWQRKRGASTEAQNRAMRLVLRAERRLGELIRVMPKAPGHRQAPKAGGGKVPPREKAPPTLAEQGIDKDAAKRFRKLADVPEKTFERHLEVVVAKGEKLTVAGAVGAVSDAEGYNGDEWFTPAPIVELCRATLGGIDLDPASNDHAQKTVKAARYFTKAQDSLTKRWSGRVFMNPPYSHPLVEHFADKLIAEYEGGAVIAAIVLVNNSTDAAWFHRLANASSAVCFTRGRIAFISRSGAGQATRQGQAFCYLGGDRRGFGEAFAKIGMVFVHPTAAP